MKLTKLQAVILFSLILSLLLSIACKEKELCCYNETTLIQDPTPEQKTRFAYFAWRKDSFNIIEYDDTSLIEVRNGNLHVGNRPFKKCIAYYANGLCKRSLQYYKIEVPCNGQMYSRFDYFIVYDYIHDSLEFHINSYAKACVSVRDLRNTNTFSYIGNYTLNNKTYSHVHKIESDINWHTVAFVNDSVGLIHFKLGNFYEAKKL